MEDDLNFSKMEDDPKEFKNGSRPHFLNKWKTITIFSKMEDDLIFKINGRRFKMATNPPPLNIKWTVTRNRFPFILQS